ncbi:Bifunctional heparan sulfate N-deacetylase/N-sulfotransferase 3 [Hondaea fermentalgiana]|uniref:Bifunctional heparan sulfate N-deacetylase/N-sulfotransferase 3 n=1 Tax=Hondaea fermentalgiana TaxID=2315210 RepID=A0A2R5GVV5_9STRA|nr:Bifunctional heparan sulfate N-deacetylase/N-sulfotransferase 3 [Hondaea fermentalgiana]|eukprot:GBG33898.1 Bifunctional heparan sulfate N-deacetylase/N-sulfotransferase 3 [Hondaea fermentalgiana]
MLVGAVLLLCSGDGREEAARVSLEIEVEATESSQETSNALSEADANNFYGDHFSVYHCRQYPEAGSLPDFMVIGVHKGGSTGLYSYLAKHGNIRPAKCKETLFFEKSSVFKKGINYYKRLFPDTSLTPGIITGEGTPGYIRHPYAVVRIAKTVPNAKFIVSLRDPVERFISHYVGFYQRQKTHASCDKFYDRELRILENCQANYTAAKHVPLVTDVNGETAWDALRRFADPELLSEALDGDAALTPTQTRETCADDDEQCKRRYCLGVKKNLESGLGRSVYVDQLVRWLRFFPAEQILVVQSEAMFKDEAGALNIVADFLGVRPFSEKELASFKNANTGSHHHNSQLSHTCDRPKIAKFFAPENDLLAAVVKAQFPETYARWIAWQR